MTDKEELRTFLMDRDDLDRVEAIAAEFNSLEILRIATSEIRHSNVLSWLLDPAGSHGLGDWFLRSFLMSMASSQGAAGIEGISIFEIDALDLSDVEIRREWQHIDIVLVSRRNKLALALENKVGAGEHEDQLQRYKEILRREYPGFTVLLAFLTPGAETPTDEDWVVCDYATVAKLVQTAVSAKRNAVSPRVSDFLEQYLACLRRYVVRGSEVERLCQDIYRKHRRALDLIFEYRPDLEGELSDHLHRLVGAEVGSQTGLLLDDCSKAYVRFTTDHLNNLVPAEGVGWTSTQRVLLFEFVSSGKQIVLRLIIGPGDAELRGKLHDVARQDGKLFNKAHRAGGKKWATIYQKEYARPADFEDGDAERLKEQLSQRFALFLTGDLPKIAGHFESGLAQSSGNRATAASQGKRRRG